MQKKGFIESVNPATGETIDSYRLESLELCDRKARKAEAAFQAWSELPVGERCARIGRLARVLRAERSEFSRLITTEMGKTIIQSEAEVEKCATAAEVYETNTEKWLRDESAETDARKSFVAFQPLGVVLSIMPWNFPFWQVLRFAIPALAAGNVSLLKHSNVCPGSSIAIGQAFADAGFPEGVFQPVIAAHDVVPELISSRRVQAVSFTGSVEAGTKVAQMAAGNLKRCVLELGGSDPFIVLADANLKRAARVAAEARLICAGQSCIAAKRFIVERTVASEFRDLFVEEFRRKRVGDPMERSTDVGPLSSAHQVQLVDRQVKDSLRAGARAALGGGPKPGPGAFFEPTVLERATRHMAVVNQEVFGPVAPLLQVTDEVEAMAVANDSEFGLGASIWTEDTEKGERLARESESGMAFVNGMVKSDPRMPFGGIKKSGIGRELSSYGLREFVNVKSVFVY